jgi:predicted nucleic acid-binding protein
VEAIIDTSAIVGLVDKSCQQHGRISDIVNKTDLKLIVPSPVIPEACYMLSKKFGFVIEIRFLEEIISVNLQIEILKFSDILRIVEILKKYKSLNIGFVDGSIVAIAERLKINQILTLDNKHFGAMIPVGFDYFDIL